MEEKGRNTNSRKEWERLASRILAAARQELYLSMRYLYLALEKMPCRPDGRVRFLGTDGSVLYFQPMRVAGRYGEDPAAVNRAYLHSVLHGLFSHMYRRGNREEAFWDAACDIAVEEVTDSLECRAVRKVVPDGRERFYKWLGQNCRIYSAEQIYEAIRRPECGWGLAELEALFQVDDHVFWSAERRKEPSRRNMPQEEERQRELWKEARERIQTEMETYSRTAGLQKSRIYQEIAYENREKTSYREFLRKFSRTAEVSKLDPDSFDFGYYQYGMHLYGNMPLLEELEYKEENRIREFAVVLDTSGSCSREQIGRFLSETVSILSEECFGSGFLCHILQCDNQIQEVVTVRGPEELERYWKGFRICGRGGTDFRPAFAYVDLQTAGGKWGVLDGILYFTDGYGIYPDRRPAYDTAFLFVEDAWPDGVPPWKAKEFPVWAMHLELPAAGEARNR